jgi:hypothetical protein
MNDMLDSLLNILGNPHFEAYVGGGLAGVVYSAMFSAFNHAPPKGCQQSLVPQEVQAILLAKKSPPREVAITTARVIQRNDDNGAVALFIGAGLGVLLALFFFAAYLPVIVEFLYTTITCVAAFSLTATLASVFGGRFRTLLWLMNAASPALISAVSFWLASLSQQAIDAKAVAYAQELMNGYPANFPGLLRGAWTFAQSIGSAYANWMMLVMTACLLLLGVVTIAACQCVHFIALANVRDNGGAAWQAVARSTLRFSGVGPFFLTWGLLALVWFLATGRVYHLMLSASGQ